MYKLKKMKDKTIFDSAFKKYFFNGFNKETVNNLNQKGIRIIKSYSELLNIISDVLSEHSNQKNYTLGTIDYKIKEKIEKDLNISIFKENQYSIIVNEDSIKHVSEHFKTKHDIAKEIVRTAQTISEYDNIRIILEKGQLRLIFEKKYKDGNIRTVETTSKTNNSLNLVTTYFTKK